MNLWTNILKKDIRASDPFYTSTFKLHISIRLHAGLCRWGSWNWDLNSPNQQLKALLWQFLEFPLRKKIIELPLLPQFQQRRTESIFKMSRYVWKILIGHLHLRSISAIFQLLWPWASHRISPSLNFLQL